MWRSGPDWQSALGLPGCSKLCWFWCVDGQLAPKNDFYADLLDAPSCTAYKGGVRMDRKEAIFRIKDHMEHHGIGKYPHLKLKEALDMAIAALSQPNEPLSVLVNDEPDREYIHYICPRCKSIISQRRRGQRMETVYKCKFHDNCGQRVDWSNPQPYRRPPEGEA